MEQFADFEMLKIAVQMFYNQQGTENSRKAAHWLAEFQKSIYAWKLSDKLLHDKYSLECCFFAAQTLHAKILQNFAELPTDAHISLRDSLFEHIECLTSSASAQSPPNYSIMTQLVLALTDLALQTSQWPNFICDLIERYSDRNPVFLFHVLTLIPEEVDTQSLKLGNCRRNELYGYLRSCAPIVVRLLAGFRSARTHTASCSLAAMEMDVLWTKCLASWIASESIRVNDLIGEPIILRKLFEILEDLHVEMKLHDYATDCLTAILQSMESIAIRSCTSPGRGDGGGRGISEAMVAQQEFDAEIFRTVGSMEKLFCLSIANEDDEKAMNYCRILTELAFAFLPTLLDRLPNQHYSFKTIDLVLVCMNHHDYVIAELTFNYWYRLSEELFKIDSEHLKMFAPPVNRLILALTQHCQMNADATTILDENEDFYEFRAKAADLVFEIVFVVGLNNCFQRLLETLQASSNEWDKMESLLYIMSTIAKNIYKDDEAVPKVIASILNMPGTVHVALRSTSIILLGELHNWINRNPKTLDSIMDFLIANTQQRDMGVTKSAVQAITNIGQGCPGELHDKVDVLMQVLQMVDARLLDQDEVVELVGAITRIVSHRLQRLLHATESKNAETSTATARYQCEQFVRYFQTLCRLQIEPLRQLLNEKSQQAVIGGAATTSSTLESRTSTQTTSTFFNSNNNNNNNNNNNENGGVAGVIGVAKTDRRQDMCTWLDRLAAVFRNFRTGDDDDDDDDDDPMRKHLHRGRNPTRAYGTHPCASCVDDVIDVLMRALNDYQLDQRLQERCCRCVRFVVRSMSTHVRPLLVSLVGLIVRIYTCSKFSCQLYLGSVLVDVYGPDPQMASITIGMLQALMPPTFEQLQDVARLQDYPSTIDDFFRLCQRYVRRTPLEFLQSPDTVTAILECALHACQFEHRDAIVSLLKFLSDFIRLAIRDSYSMYANEQVQLCIEQSASEFVKAFQLRIIARILIASITYYSFSMTYEVSDLFMNLMNYDQNLFANNLKLALEQMMQHFETIPFYANKITQDQLTIFHSSVIRGKLNEDISYALRSLMQVYR